MNQISHDALIAAFDNRRVYRTPAVMIPPKTSILEITSIVNGTSNYSVKTETLDLKSWTTVIISQLPQLDGTFSFSVKTGNTTISEVINTNAMQFTNATVYLNNPLNAPSNALIRNMDIKTFPGISRGMHDFDHFCTSTAILCRLYFG